MAGELLDFPGDVRDGAHLEEDNVGVVSSATTV